MPLVTAFQGGEAIESFPREASAAYQSWVGDENDVYDEIFAESIDDFALSG
jgi:hypothetical protein